MENTSSNPNCLFSGDGFKQELEEIKQELKDQPPIAVTTGCQTDDGTINGVLHHIAADWQPPSRLLTMSSMC